MVKIDGKEIPLADVPIIVEDIPPRKPNAVDLSKGVTYTIAVDYAQTEPPAVVPRP